MRESVREPMREQKRRTLLLRTLLLAALCAPAAPAWAEREASICFNYACAARAAVRFSTDDLKLVQEEFATVTDAADERRAIASAVAKLYAVAATQSPIGADRGGNIEDDGVEGRMDCIDHSTNTTTWLTLLAENGWLRHHDVGDRVRRSRFVIFEHWSATVVESATRAQYAVDSWFHDPGNPAEIFPLRQWLGGAYPAGTSPLGR
jgi:hypothetical protein